MKYQYLYINIANYSLKIREWRISNRVVSRDESIISEGRETSSIDSPGDASCRCHSSRPVYQPLCWWIGETHCQLVIIFFNKTAIFAAITPMKNEEEWKNEIIVIRRVLRWSSRSSCGPSPSDTCCRDDYFQQQSCCQSCQSTQVRTPPGLIFDLSPPTEIPLASLVFIVDSCWGWLRTMQIETVCGEWRTPLNPKMKPFPDRRNSDRGWLYSRWVRIYSPMSETMNKVILLLYHTVLFSFRWSCQPGLRYIWFPSTCSRSRECQNRGIGEFDLLSFIDWIRIRTRVSWSIGRTKGSHPRRFYRGTVDIDWLP